MAAPKASGPVERKINIGLMTYLSPDGLWLFGQLGDVVQVHPGDAERFDRLNPEPVEK